MQHKKDYLTSFRFHAWMRPLLLALAESMNLNSTQVIEHVLVKYARFKLGEEKTKEILNTNN